ncbi:class A beta-lactamase-related serine hydrolase [Nocardiopsis sp. RSe5-2]|uniref:Class A beta-lactamase-related serine hydrolase n=1 Tax=Nocardiopsis endophytica TaxID=3018445 RepID=A0ABT4UC16_9ACTN|nr:serine hydrolase [Nocardiopsis endophytica]MDA2814518.1 class A beta-lactamase-related serine hydrolase [Nocardiopsis endophytica]
MREEAFLRRLREELDDGGLRGSFLVRDLDSGEEIGIEPDLEFSTASLVKIPLAMAVLERIRRGDLDGAEPVVLTPGVDAVPGPTGVSRFRHPVRIAVEDLLYMSMAVSDNAAAEALFGFTPPAEVAELLKGLGLSGVSIRNTLRDMRDTPETHLARSDGHLAQRLAIEAGTEGRGHSVPQLDVTRASAGSARAYVDLLQELWRPRALPEWTAAQVRDLMGANLMRQRLTPDFASDATVWSSKTGTLLNLRHEIGVVEHDGGGAYAVAALTESRVAAILQPEAEALMGGVARRLRDRLRAA